MGHKKLSAKRAARELAKIASQHLESLPQEEREARILAAEKRLATSHVTEPTA